ncbi:amidohydrolase family protein [Sphingomonas sp. PL-96]|uniref:amidohydrolase family protein n=1 Tax=Sphingomonas sp. PL-96 TaxID=2887201 RepID=UPI001E4C97E9|nr:amidohydrolase family protein [Sphingomonas sp. PL-96]MCC2978295.1 amidohydrolase family protein [Sphingomonas sp. PL-96]
MTAAPLPFVDAHIHLWDLAHIRYPWLTPPFADGPNGNVEAIARNYLTDDYRADAGKWAVAGAVHIDAGADASEALRETEWLEGVADTDALPTAIVAFASLDAPDVDRQLTAQAAHRRVRGIRQIVNWHVDPRRSYTPEDLTRDERWQAGFTALGRHGLSFDLQCYPAQMPGLAPLIERRPDVPVILNHLGMPVLSDPEGVAQWREGLKALAAIPHVAIKLSGLGFIDRNWTLDRIRPFLEEAVALFGPDRCMMASDSPTDTLFAPFDRTMQALYDFSAPFSDDERRDLFGRTANRIYRLGLSL